jgi:hypothetical protein
MGAFADGLGRSPNPIALLQNSIGSERGGLDNRECPINSSPINSSRYAPIPINLPKIHDDPTLPLGEDIVRGDTRLNTAKSNNNGQHQSPTRSPKQILDFGIKFHNWTNSDRKILIHFTSIVNLIWLKVIDALKKPIQELE